MKKFFGTKIGIAVIILLVGSGLVIFLVGRSDAPMQTVIAKRGTIQETINVTGNIRAVSQADLAFARSGRLSRVLVETGSRVKSGQTLLALDASDLAAQRTKNLASLQSAQAKLDQLEAGGREEDIIIAKTALDNAELVLDRIERQDATDGLRKAHNTALNSMVSFLEIKQRYYVSDSVVYGVEKKYQDALRAIIDTSSPSTVYASAVLSSPSKLRDRINAFADNPSREPVHDLIYDTRMALENVKEALDAMSAALNIPSVGAIEADKNTVISARASVLTDIAGLGVQDQAITTAENAIRVAMSQYNSVKAPTSKYDLDIARANVAQAKGDLAFTQSQIAQTIIVAPSDGLVTSIAYKKGETISAGVVAISMLNDSDYDIESNVPETDVSKISVSRPVMITIDAFPGEIFNGYVSQIDPGEKVIDGVVIFRVTVRFNALDPRFRSGLTSNLEISVAEKPDVVIVPSIAVLETDRGVFVYKVTGTTSTEYPVKVGIRADDGSVEIISGVSEGDILENIGTRRP